MQQIGSDVDPARRLVTERTVYRFNNGSIWPEAVRQLSAAETFKRTLTLWPDSLGEEMRPNRIAQ